MAETPKLAIPVMEASQAQKHVTFNDAMLQIEATLGQSVNANGAETALRVLSETLVGLSGATATTTIAFPNQSLILGASLLVTKAITGATSFDVGDGTTVNAFGGGIGIAQNTRNQGTLGVPSGNFSVTPVVLTANGGNFTDGDVIVNLHYIELETPPFV